MIHIIHGPNRQTLFEGLYDLGSSGNPYLRRVYMMHFGEIWSIPEGQAVTLVCGPYNAIEVRQLPRWDTFLEMLEAQIAEKHSPSHELELDLKNPAFCRKCGWLADKNYVPPQIPGGSTYLVVRQAYLRWLETKNFPYPEESTLIIVESN